MKRWLVAMMAAVMVMSFAAMPVSAAGYGQRNRMTDADGDGVCDLWNENCGYQDENNDGICDNRENDPGDDGLGNADNNGGNGLAYGKRMYRYRCYARHMNRKAPCIRKNFVDADGNGICDRLEEAVENTGDRPCTGNLGSCDGTGPKGYGRGRNK